MGVCRHGRRVPCRTIRRVPGRELFAELDALFNAQYPGRAAKPGSVTTPAEMAPPSGAFLVGYEDGRAVAIGGLRAPRRRRLRDQADVRGAGRPFAGVGRALLAALEDAARRLGFHTVRLDAGEEQKHSRVLFANTGYREIPPYNGNHIAVYFGEKDLSGS